MHTTHTHTSQAYRHTYIHARTHARIPRHSHLHRTATNKHAHKNRRSFTTVFDDSSSRLPYARVLTSKRAVPPFYGKHVLLATVLALARDEHSPTFTVQATVHVRAWYMGLPPSHFLLHHYLGGIRCTDEGQQPETYVCVCHVCLRVRTPICMVSNPTLTMSS